MVIGDHILDQISPVILIESSADVNPLMDYFDSLEKIKEYSIRLAFLGHGNPIENLNKRIEQLNQATNIGWSKCQISQKRRKNGRSNALKRFTVKAVANWPIAQSCPRSLNVSI